MDNLEVIKRARKQAGYRENNILDNLAKMYRVRTNWNDEHKIMHFESKDGCSFEYDIVTNKITN